MMYNRSNLFLGLGVIFGAILYSLRDKRSLKTSKKINKDNWSVDELDQLTCNGSVIFKNNEIISLIENNLLFEKLKEIKFKLQTTIITNYIFNLGKRENIVGIKIVYNELPVRIKKIYFELESDKNEFELILKNINRLKISKTELIKTEED